ncbi:MAG TPA: PP2C family protein-serine/threonine phosphatase [Thermoanaerobaculia bacterium]|nr:PP2C family protein-serine/threonine phosphatase [Thermoanaerobaculia bacterium]
MTSRTGNLRLLLALALGALVLALGITLARQWLPEWQAERLPSQSSFVERFQALAQGVGVRLEPGVPRVAFARHDKNFDLDDSVLDGLTPAEAADVGAGVIVEVRQGAKMPGREGRRRELSARFSTSGHPLAIRFGGSQETISSAIHKDPVPAPEVQALFVRQLLRPGESLGQSRPGGLEGIQGMTYPVQGSRPPQKIVASAMPGSLLMIRQLEPKPKGKDMRSTAETVARVLLVALPLIAGSCIAFILFFVLLGRRRISIVNGAWLGGIVFVVAAVPTLAAEPTWAGALILLGVLFIALWASILWSTGESYLRSAQPEVTVSLDALRAGRLGPRGGRALVWGIACGAGLAGLRLAAEAVAARLPNTWPEEGSLRLPVFDVLTPFFDGVVLAGGVALAMGLAWRFVPARWAAAAGALAAGLAIPFTSLHPTLFQAAVNVAAATVLVFLSRRVGLAAGLTAALSTYLLQAAAFCALYAALLPVSLAVTAGTPALLLVLGFVGLRRPADPELDQLKQPAFMKRIEEERRLKYEMDLLARMQLGLLPQQLPRITGWEVAASSLLASEAGGDLYDFFGDEEGFLWIAAGDVAGHGYSCSIAQAMTVASLSSLITATETPAGVLQRVDKVLRRNAHRHFTTLALLRLDPRTGTGHLANAGHPYALLSAEGQVSEIPLAGLPLGQGPKRTYHDAALEIPPGAALVFASDGLFEATDLRGTAYGYDRPREVLHGLAGKTATEILDGLLADWRRYRAGVEQQDDTTVVVVKRL